MRRFLSISLILCCFLSGCDMFGERIKEPVAFYYLRSEYQYFTQDGVIASEEREAAGHRDDLSYLLALYLMGPSEDDLKSPLPRSIRIISTEQTAEGIFLHLSDTETNMTDMDFSAACACLSLTCFNLTNTKMVTITSGDRSVTISRDALVLYDSNPAVEETQ